MIGPGDAEGDQHAQAEGSAVPGRPDHDRRDARGWTIPAWRGVLKTLTTTPWNSPLRVRNAGWPFCTAPVTPDRRGAGRTEDRGCTRFPITSARTCLMLTGSTGTWKTTRIATIVPMICSYICTRSRSGSPYEGLDGVRCRQGSNCVEAHDRRVEEQRASRSTGTR